jgi:hypothetical protein
MTEAHFGQADVRVGSIATESGLSGHVRLPPVSERKSGHQAEFLRRWTHWRFASLYLLRLSLGSRNQMHPRVLVWHHRPFFWPLPVTESVVLSPDLRRATNATVSHRRSRPH